MARPRKEDYELKNINDLIDLMINQSEALCELTKRVESLEEFQRYVERNKSKVSIQKVEEFNGEVVPEQVIDNMKFTHEEKIYSIINTVKILPPNLVKDGRHSIENVQALNGRFIVTDELMDEAYSQYSHSEF